MTPFDFIDRPLDVLNQSDLMLIFDVAELSAPPMRKRLLKTLLRRLNRQPQRDDELLGHAAYALAALSGNKRRKRLKIALRCFARMAHRQPENGFAQIYLAYTLYDLGKFKGSLKALRASPKTISPNAANAGAVWSGSNWPSAACCGWAKPATCPRSLPICLPAPPAPNRLIVRSPRRLPPHCNGWLAAANRRANKIQIRQPENT